MSHDRPEVPRVDNHAAANIRPDQAREFHGPAGSASIKMSQEVFVQQARIAAPPAVAQAHLPTMELKAPPAPMQRPEIPAARAPEIKAPCPPEQHKPEIKPPVQPPVAPPEQHKPEVKPPVQPPVAPPEQHKPEVKVPCPPNEHKPEIKPPVQPPVAPPEQHKPEVKVPCPPKEHKPEVKPPAPPVAHKPDEKPCPPKEHKPEVKPPAPPVAHKPDEKPCPPKEHKPEVKPPAPPVAHKPDEKPCPPKEHKPEVKPPAPPAGHKPDEKPCPPKKPPEQPVPPKKPPEVPCPPVKPPVKPPEVPVQPPPPPRPSDTPRQVAVRYSPPAEPLRPFRNSDYQTPPAKTSVETPGTVTTQRTETSTETTTVTGRQSEAAIAIPATAGKVETEVRRQETLRATGAVVGLGGEKPGHQAGTPRSSGEGRGHGGDHAVPERTPGKLEAQLRGTAEIEQSTAVEIKQTERPATAAVVAATGEAQVAVTTERASSEAASVQVTPPAADSSETPGQKTTSSNTWGEVSLSYSPGTKTTVATGTVGKFFDQQNYGYVQGTADLTKGKMGNVSAMYGHSILTPYDEKGQARRGNVNVEAGVVLNTGETLQGSKLPLFGKTAARVGVNGYYNLDQEGKTTVYGSADYASNPKQADAQVGISHKFAHDVTVSGGYQVSKVEGYQAGHYATTAISMKLSDRAEVYAGAAVSLDKQKGGNTNQVYTGVRFSF